MKRFTAIVLCALLSAGVVACSSSGEDATTDTVSENGLLGADTGDCLVVDMAVSPEKIDLMISTSG